MGDRKRKLGQFSLNHLLFAHRANESLLSVRLYEETNGSYPFANGLNRLNGPNALAHLCSQAAQMCNQVTRLI